MMMMMMMPMMTTMIQGDRCGGGAQGQQGTPTRRRGYHGLPSRATGRGDDGHFQMAFSSY